MTLYVGNDDAVTQKVKKAYIGVDGVGKEIKAMYVGDDNGIARKVFPDGGPTPPGLDYVIFYSPVVGFKMRIPNGYTYSLDNGGTWIDSNNSVVTATNTENEIWVKYKTVRTQSNSDRFAQGAGNQDIRVKGELLKLIGEDSNGNSKAFHAQYLFDVGITDVSELQFPSYVSDGCCEGMFKNSPSLVNPPILPATTLAKNCYKEMFSGSSLTDFIPLPATVLAEGCYEKMFQGCLKITSFANVVLPATNLGKGCYKYMFSDVRNASGTPPALPATIMKEECYCNMFSGCKNLTVTPSLPATTLADKCYAEMFRHCYGLISPYPELPATELAPYCYRSMFADCGNLTTREIPKNYLSHISSLKPYCFENMFFGSRFEILPELPWLSLEEGCYKQMFAGSEILKSVFDYFTLPAINLAPSCYEGMFNGTYYYEEGDWEFCAEYMPTQLISNMNYIDIPQFAFCYMYYDSFGLGDNLYFCDAYDDPDPEYGEYNFIINVTGNVEDGAFDCMFGCTSGNIYPETDMMDSDGTPLVTNEPIGYYWD